MANSLDYAQLAGRVYNRTALNKIGLTNWDEREIFGRELEPVDCEPPSGFEAINRQQAGYAGGQSGCQQLISAMALAGICPAEHAAASCEAGEPRWRIEPSLF